MSADMLALYCSLCFVLDPVVITPHNVFKGTAEDAHMHSGVLRPDASLADQAIARHLQGQRLAPTCSHGTSGWAVLCPAL